MTSSDATISDTTTSDQAPAGTAAAGDADRALVGGEWVRACPLEILVPGRGVGVLGPAAAQAALYRVPTAESDREATPGRTRLYALGNIDPFARAAVMSRGLTGDRAGEPTVASPIGKQVFSLRTGICLDDESVALPSFAVRVTDGIVEVYFPT